MVHHDANRDNKDEKRAGPWLIAFIAVNAAHDIETGYKFGNDHAARSFMVSEVPVRVGEPIVYTEHIVWSAATPSIPFALQDNFRIITKKLGEVVARM